MPRSPHSFERRLQLLDCSDEERERLRRSFRALVDQIRTGYRIDARQARVIAEGQLRALPLRTGLRSRQAQDRDG